MKNVAGIYSITNSLTMDVYVGKATDLNHRRRSHFQSLKKGTHANLLLQASYNADGPSAFVWSVVEICPVNTPAYDGSEKWFRLFRESERDRTKWLCDKEAHYIREIPATLNMATPPKFCSYGWSGFPEESSWENVDEHDDLQPEKPAGLLFSIREMMPNEVQRSIQDALLHLPNREREAVEVYWGIEGRNRTMSDLSRQNGISPQRMHQIRLQGEKRLKERVGRDWLVLRRSAEKYGETERKPGPKGASK